MKFEVYALYDCKMEEFSEPFIQRSQAVDRSVQILISKSPIPKDDLTLWTLGTWDSEIGILKAYEHPIFVQNDIVSDVVPQSLIEKGVIE